MKSLLNKIIIPFFGLGLMITACSDWTELEPKYAKDLTQTDKSEEYYEALRAYKQSDHAVAFGWYGNATGIGVSLVGAIFCFQTYDVGVTSDIEVHGCIRVRSGKIIFQNDERWGKYFQTLQNILVADCFQFFFRISSHRSGKAFSLSGIDAGNYGFL